MKTGKSLTSLAVLSALVSQPVAAQSLSPFDNHGRVETRAMAGVTIPLGGKRRSADTKPRFDLRFDTSRIDAQHASSLDPLRQNRRDLRQSVFSVTFERRPQLMLNGHGFAQVGPSIYAQDGDEESAEETEDGGGISTLGWIGIGAAAFAGVVVWAGLELEDELEDAFGEPD